MKLSPRFMIRNYLDPEGRRVRLVYALDFHWNVCFRLTRPNGKYTDTTTPVYVYPEGMSNYTPRFKGYRLNFQVTMHD